MHRDGREAVFDGDTGRLITDARHGGTYNYVNPRQWEGIQSAPGYVAGNAGHLVADVLPYAVGGNARGEH